MLDEENYIKYEFIQNGKEGRHLQFLHLAFKTRLCGNLTHPS